MWLGSTIEDAKELDRLRAEIKRLRAALQEMTDAIDHNGIDSQEMLDVETGAPRGKWHEEWRDRAGKILNEQLTPEEISRTIPQIGEKR